MTIKQVLDKVEALKPSQYTDSDKVGWLAQLDGQIDVETIRTHQGAPETEFEPYNPDGNYIDSEGEDYLGDTELLVPFPYDKLYVDFLCSQIDFYNAEYGRFNNTMQRFQAGYSEFEAWYNREHMPISSGPISVGGCQEKSILPPELEA